MLEAIRANARISERDAEGNDSWASLRIQAAKGNAKPIAQLAAAENIPEALDYLYDFFNRLDLMRDFDMNGPKRFTPAHIRDGMELFGVSLSHAEIDAVVMMDLAKIAPGPWLDADG